MEQKVLQKIGKYEIIAELGQGGMGVVYEAFDRKLKRNVAIKMLRDEYKLDDAAKASFMEEARTVAELHHPAIVDIHNIIEDDRGLYLVFERLEGRTLEGLGIAPRTIESIVPSYLWRFRKTGQFHDRVA